MTRSRTRDAGRPALALTLALALAAGLLGGCITKDAPETRFYVLGPLPAGSAALEGARRARPLAVDVMPVRLPQYLARPQIVTRSGDNRLQLAEYHQWGGNLGKNFTRVLSRNLVLLLATTDVTLFPRRPPAPADVRIEVEVMEFERGPDDHVRLSAQWRLLDGDGKPLLTRVTDLASPEPARGPGFDATVAAMGALAGELSRMIAATILEARPA